MDAAAVKKVSREVYQRYPHMNGTLPKVSQQTEDRYLLLFTKSVEISSGRSMDQTIRVIADGQGHVLKLSSSKS